MPPPEGGAYYSFYIMKQLLSFLLLLTSLTTFGQYPPQVGLPGCTAIAGSSSQLVAWASQCTIYRGLMCIDSPALGNASAGDSSLALGRADRSVVSLGDSGVAVLTFPGFIYDGEGADFAVFENGFANPLNDSQAFLELAFVEVSSDGVNYTRFPAQSLTQTNVQIPGSGVYMYANLLHNLAGNYLAGYGTPFDLSELAGTPGLDINHITHVRVVDVIGDISPTHASHDSSGRVINDPYPTNFPTSGFDLDAVGVIHISGDAGMASVAAGEFRIYPNPAKDIITIENTNGADGTVTISDIAGYTLSEVVIRGNNNSLNISNWAPGIYFLSIQQKNGYKCVQKIVKY